MSTRRKFLKILGFAPAAAATTSADILSAVGLQSPLGALRDSSGCSMQLVTSEMAVPPANPAENSASLAYDAYHAWKLINGKSVPDHILEDIIRNSKDIYALDSDLAVNRSYSLSFKMYLQRQRNIERRVKMVLYDIEHRNKRNLFAKLFGFDLY
jgi:hypothetical protein